MADFDAMQTFVAVMRTGSFRGAAESLRIPRSTVSQRVARLEERLGVRLLERHQLAGAGLFERAQRGGVLRFELAGARGHFVFEGAPEQVADLMQDWIEEGVADGFNLMPPVLPEK